jgi:hypothetical protein
LTFAKAVFVAGALLSGAGVARADLPPDRQAVILTRALSYDNNLRGRAGDSVVLAVVYRAGNAASESMADSVYKAFKTLEGVKIQDLPFKTVKMAFSSKDALRAAIGAQGIDAVYACAGMENDLGAVREIGRAQHVLTIGTREADVQAGLSLGVFVTDGKAMINVNLPASREEGAAFSSELLRLARVVH